MEQGESITFLSPGVSMLLLALFSSLEQTLLCSPDVKLILLKAVCCVHLIYLFILQNAWDFCDNSNRGASK